MIDHTHALAVVRQAELAGLSRASVYYLPRFACEADQRLMKRIDVCVSSTHSRAHRKTKGLARVNVLTLVFSGAAGRNRTHDPLVRSQVLYPAELQPRSRRL